MKKLTPAIRRIAAFVAVLAVAAAWAAPASAGAWMRKPGEYYFKLSGAYLYSTERYNSDGDLVPFDSDSPTVIAAAFRDISITAYLEYGMSERVTLVASLPYKNLTNERTEFSSQFDAIREIEAVNGGMTDLRAGTRFPLRTESFPVSIESIVKLPLGYDPEPEETQLAPLGSGKVDFDIVLLAGTSLWPFPGYVNGSAGYRFRGGGLDDEFLANVEGGVTYRSWFAKLALDALYTTGDLVDADPTITVTNENVLKLMGEINYSINSRFAVSFEVFHVLTGANTVAGTTWVAGVVMQRNDVPTP